MEVVIPETIRVGGLNYRVEIVDDLEDDDACAKTHYNKTTIKIERAGKDFMQQVFLHELMHTVNSEWEEERVEFMAMALFQIIRDNPGLFQEVQNT